MDLVKVQTKLMGNMFEFIALSDNERLGNEQITCAIDEVKRIEKLFTTFSDESVTNEVNRNAGKKTVVVPDEFFLFSLQSTKDIHANTGVF